jgi:hypothetical protein
MAKLLRPALSDGDQDGWIDVWLGLHARLSRARRAILDAARSTDDRDHRRALQPDSPFVLALLGIVSFAGTIDAQLASLVRSASPDSDEPIPREPTQTRELLR